MQQNKTLKTNTLDIYRRRMGFTTRHVARLLGDRDTSRISKYERGHRLPELRNALRLGIILRVPVEFLFASLYDSLREQIRAEEERIAQPAQATLF
jgi:transcriptional regulator with XRE-family HTH domain